MFLNFIQDHKMIDKKVAGLFLEIDSELQEYQKKELCILILASMINPKPCNELSALLGAMAKDMNKEYMLNDYPDQLN